MKFLKQFLIMVACYSMVIQSTFANVGPEKLKKLNTMATIDNVHETVKSFFPTSEDQKQINSDFIKLKAITKNWDWRFEKQGDGVAFRLNGKVQYVTTVDTSKPDSFFVDGKEVKILKGMSYLSFKNEFGRVLKMSALNLDALFFEKAYADGGFLAVLAGIGLFTSGVMIGRAQCHNHPNCREYTCRKTSRGAGPHHSRPTVNPHPREVVDQPRPRRVYSQGSCTQRGRKYSPVLGFTGPQMWVVAQNYRFNCRYPHTMRNGDQVMRIRRRCFDTVQDCVNWKARKPHHVAGRRNLTPAQARIVCQSAYNEVCACRSDCRATNPYMPRPTPYKPAPQHDVPNDWDVVPPGAEK